ncbi:MAG: MerR family DNA-binding transcriptional regulator [Microthrixaceae bacterium]
MGTDNGASDGLSHLSIGEVLTLLQAEFPDITISKIRFLESQGLIDPERTPSGYRRFYEADIARLRWVLRQQRDHFLPLKVIKQKLETPGAVDIAVGEERLPDRWSEPIWSRPDAPGSSGVAGEEPATATDGIAHAGSARPGEAPRGSTMGGHDVSDAAPVPSADDATADMFARLAATTDPSRRRGRVDSSAGVSEDGDVGSIDQTSDTTGLRFAIADVAEVTGMSVEQIHDMVEYGFVVPATVGGELTFDASAVAVVRAIGGFTARGIEPRHLKMFKNAASREVGFYEQMILPMLRQRNPKARQAAVSTLASLMEEGEALSRALVRHGLHPHLDG